MLIIKVILGSIIIFLDYAFPKTLYLFAGFIGFTIITSKNTRSALLQVFIFSSLYFFLFSTLSPLWTILYLTMAYLFKTVLNQISKLKFELIFLSGLNLILYIPFLINQVNLTLKCFAIALWMFPMVIVHIIRRKKPYLKKEKNKRWNENSR